MPSRKGARAAAVAAALLVAAAAARAETWKAYTYAPAATLAAAKGLNEIAERVEKETAGRLKIQVHIGGSLPIDTTNITQAVGDGIVQFAADGFYLGNVTVGGVLRLPMLLTDDEQYAKALAVMLPYVERAYDRRGAVVLGTYRYPLQVAWANKPLAALADMAGKKMRVTSPEQGEFVKRFGAVPVTLGGPEVPPALQRGVVEGVFTASAGGGKIWGELLTHNYRLGPNYFESFVIANKDAFRALPAESQAALRRIVAEVAPTITATMAREEAEVTAALKAKGMTVTEARAEDVAAASKRMADFWDEWAKAKGPEHVEALAKVRAAIGK